MYSPARYVVELLEVKNKADMPVETLGVEWTGRAAVGAHEIHVPHLPRLPQEQPLPVVALRGWLDLWLVLWRMPPQLEVWGEFTL